MRTVDEWIGKDDDHRPPPRVRLRVFERYEGVCYLTGRKIRPGDSWDLEHIVALCNGGTNSESNMAPALRTAHKKKTAEDRRQKAKSDSVRRRHLGIKKPRTMTRWRNFKGEIVTASKER